MLAFCDKVETVWTLFIEYPLGVSGSKVSARVVMPVCSAGSRRVMQCASPREVPVFIRYGSGEAEPCFSCLGSVEQVAKQV